MRVYVSCWQCSFDKLPRVQHVLPLREDTVFEIECELHGKNIVDLQTLKFELLFESGALAIADDRTREGVLDLGASLERFHEFYIDYFRCSRTISDEAYSTFWKPLKNVSERQLGAFLFAYLLDTGSPAPYPNGWAEFRNRVVHQGYIPSVEEAVKHGEELRQFMYSIIDDMKSRNKPGILMAQSYHYFRRLPIGPPQPEGARVSGLHIPTLVGLWQLGERKSFQQYVGDLRKWYRDHCSRCGAKTA